APPEEPFLAELSDSGVDLGSVEAAGQPMSSGNVVMASAQSDASLSGRDLIAEAVESGIDGNLAMPAMDEMDEASVEIVEGAEIVDEEFVSEVTSVTAADEEVDMAAVEVDVETDSGVPTAAMELPEVPRHNE